jgi:sulfur-oxidizing protein SoxX
MAGSRRSPRKCSVERRAALTVVFAAAAAITGAARADEPGSGRVSGARTIELPRWPLASLASAAGGSFAQQGLRPYAVVGDAIPDSLTGTKGDPERGRTIVVNRQVGLCLLCHSGPYPDERFQGTLAPDLKGAGSRSSEGQLRLRIVDASRLNPDTIMPPYYRTEGLARVATAFQGKPVLTAEQIEDVIAHLATLRD